MADQPRGNDPNQFGRDMGDRIRQDVHDRINARLDAKRSRWEAKMERRRLRWQARAYRHRNPFGGILVGFLLAGIGVLLLLQNLGILSIDELWDYWPVILIVFGGSRLVSSWDAGGRIFGAILLAVGGIFLLRNFGLLHANVWAYFWPVVLIAIGLALLARALGGSHAWDLWTDHHSSNPPTDAGAGTAFSPPASSDLRNTFREEHIFSGARRTYDTQEFEGGEVLAIFGGAELDLRKAATKRDQVIIEANAFFGGVEIRVPDAWRVELRGTGIFGGYADETMQAVSPEIRRPVLIVTGSAVFGGVSVKN
jgi:predicted membrane protein